MNDIRAIAKGDASVFEKVYKLYHERLYFFVLKQTGSDFIAEEVVQLAFIKLWQRKEKLVYDIPLAVQLFRIAKTVMIDELRREQVQLKHAREAAVTPFTDSLLDAIENKDLMKHIRQAIEALPRMQKTVFNLSREQGLSHKEIADMLSITPKTVENHIAKTLRHLKESILSFLL